MVFSSEIIQVVREQIIETEKVGKLAPNILEYIYENRLFKLFVPNDLDGDMTSLPDALKIFEKASWIDGSFGWLVTIGAGGGYFVPSISIPLCHEIFLSEDSVIAGSGAVTGKAVRVQGGYLVTGRWKYCSGALHATIFTANCFIEDEGNKSKDEIRSFIFKSDQVEIIEDWNTAGLKGTGSHTIAVNHIFIPEEMTFSIEEKLSYQNEPLYSFPFLQFAQTSFAAIVIGICEHFLDEAKTLIEEKQESWSLIPNRVQMVAEKLHSVEKDFRTKVREFFQIVEYVWGKHVGFEQLTENDLRRLSEACIDVAAVSRSAVCELFPYLGMDAIKEESTIYFIWKDVQTACQHILLSPLYK